MSKRLTTEEFIKRSISIHGDKYIYDRTVYKNRMTEVEIFCKKCGIYFKQMPPSHFRGYNGCVQCGVTKKLTTNIFIKKAKIKHGDKYSYDKTVYVSAKIEVTVTCNIHGDFDVTPDTLLSAKFGCQECASESRVRKRTKTKEKFLSIAEKAHGQKFEYDLSNFKGMQSRITIICKEHGPFTAFARDHVVQAHGCYECGIQAISSHRRLTLDEIIDRIYDMHGITYEYDFTNFFSVADTLHVRCEKHGWFETLGMNHIYRGSGCPRCKSSIGENTVRNALTKYGVNFEGQYRIGICRNIKPLPFDFAVLNKNNFLKGLIEFHGQQHFREVGVFGGGERFIYTNKSDQIKSDFCDFNGIPFLVIPYWDSNKIEEVIPVFVSGIRRKKPITEFKIPPQLTIFNT